MKKKVWIVVFILLVPISARAAIVDIRVSNHTSAGVTISWITDAVVQGEVHYGEAADLSGRLTAYDQRGQEFEGCTHYVNIAYLKKETTYYFEVASGSEVSEIEAFRTMKEPIAPPGFCPAYGFVFQQDGLTGAEGAVVYLHFTHGGVDSYPLSKLIAPQGSFLFTMLEARSTQTDDLFPSIDASDPIQVEAVYCDESPVLKNLFFDRCTYDCGSLIFGSGQMTTTVPSSTTTTAASTTIPTTTSTSVSTTTSVPTTTSSTVTTTTGDTTTSSTVTTTTVVTTSVPGTTTTSLVLPPTTTTSTVVSTSSTVTTSIPSITTTIPRSNYQVTVDPPTARVIPFGRQRFTVRTTRDGETVEGNYRWYLDSTRGSSINQKGLFRAGAFPETVMVMVVDVENENSSASASVTVTQLWPGLYEEMWGADKAQTLSSLRSFRDRVMLTSKAGREYVAFLYNNSTEVALLLIFNPLLRLESRDLMDMLLPEVQSLLEGEKVVIARNKLGRIELFLYHMEKAAVSQGLKKTIKKLSDDLGKNTAFQQLGIFISRE